MFSIFGYTIIKQELLDELRFCATQRKVDAAREKNLLDRIERLKGLINEAIKKRDEARRALADERTQRLQLSDLVGRYDEIARKLQEMQGKTGQLNTEE